MGKRSGIMLAYPFTEKRLMKWPLPYIVQPKLNGIRAWVDWHGDAPFLVSSEKNIIWGVPHICDQLQQFYYQTNLKPNFDGELYTHGMSFQEIESRVSREVNLHQDHEQINYHIFDLKEPKLAQMDRSIQLFHLGSNSGLPDLKFVRTFMAHNMTAVYDYLRGFIDDAYEGIIVRHLMASYVEKRSTYMMKFKPRADDWYTIVDTVEEISQSGEPKDQLGAFWVKDSDGRTFKVAGSLPHEVKQELWAKRNSLPGKQLHVWYQHTSDGGKPVHAVPDREDTLKLMLEVKGGEPSG